ncbi:hypothetical protein [Novosphingobium sp. HII-3]|nr:hypothetical protein [Novosphingobium sp. HII-3]
MTLKTPFKDLKEAVECLCLFLSHAKTPRFEVILKVLKGGI